MASIRKVKKQIKKLPTELEKTEFGNYLKTLRPYHIGKRGLYIKYDYLSCNTIGSLLRSLEFRRQDAAFRNRIFRNERLRKRYANPFRKRLK